MASFVASFILDEDRTTLSSPRPSTSPFPPLFPCAQAEALVAALKPHLTPDTASKLAVAGVTSIVALAALSVADIRATSGLGLLPARRLKDAAEAVVRDLWQRRKHPLESRVTTVRAELDSGLQALLTHHDLLLKVGPILVKEKVKYIALPRISLCFTPALQHTLLCTLTVTTPSHLPRIR